MSDDRLVPEGIRDPSFLAFNRLASRLGAIPLDQVLTNLIDNVDVSALPHLAEQFSLTGDGWDMAESETGKRDLLKDAIAIHMHKGTPWSVRQVFRALGLGEVTIHEGRSGWLYDGQVTHDGFPLYDDPTGWAWYRVHMFKLLTSEQADRAKAMLAMVVPARCHLFDIDMSGAALIYNSVALYDGNYNHGAY